MATMFGKENRQPVFSGVLSAGCGADAHIISENLFECLKQRLDFLAGIDEVDRIDRTAFFAHFIVDMRTS